MQMRLVMMGPGQAVSIKDKGFSVHDGVLEIHTDEGDGKGEIIFYSLACVEWFKASAPDPEPVILSPLQP